MVADKLRRGGAIASAFDEGVEAGDERFDVGGEASDLFRQCPLPFNQTPLSFDQGLLTFDQGPLAFGYRMKDLLSFEMLLTDTQVELSEALFLEAIALPQ